jgi:hypothetical protein
VRSKQATPGWLAGVLATVVMLLPAACGADGTARLSPRRPLELSVGAPNRSRVPSPLVVGALVPGTYSTTRLATRLTLMFGEGWNLANETPGELALTRGPLTKTASILRFVLLRHAWQVAPPWVTDQETPADWIKRSRKAPSDYISFVQSLGEYLDVGPLTPLRVAGRQARAVTYMVAREASTGPGTCYEAPGACFAPPSGVRLDTVSLPVGYTVRAAVVHSAAGPVLIETAAPDGAQLDELLTVVDPMLESMQLG